MRFGPVPVQDALGGLLAHTLHLDTGVLRKGTRLEEKHLHELSEGGFDRVTVAHLDPEDVAENDAAHRLATAASPGVSAEIADRIFLPFFSTKQEGSGIGLALTRQIVMVHRGALVLLPDRDKGACFRLTL